MSCENHKKDVAGIEDMKVLAEMIGDLHYESLRKFLVNLGYKLLNDSSADREGGRINLSSHLFNAALHIGASASDIERAWQISKPFMESDGAGTIK